jgi:hypothetical protein
MKRSNTLTLLYLESKSWKDITREERFFCSHLYHTIINREKESVGWLNNNTTLKLNPNSNWEVGYEVCFYRDLIKYWKEKGKFILMKNHIPQREHLIYAFSLITI